MSTDKTKTELNEHLEFQIQVANILIHRSNFELLNSGEESAIVDFSLHASIYETRIQAHLRVHTLFSTTVVPSSDVIGFNLNYCVLGEFKTDASVEEEIKRMFVEQTVTSILLPHAREYHGDVVRRLGFPHAILPLIDPSALVDQMRADNSISIKSKSDD